MAEIPLQRIPLDGVDLTDGAAAAGDTAQVGPNKFLVVRNGSGASVTVTVAVPGNDFTGAARPDLAKAVPAGKTRVIPLADVYADDGLSGQAAVTYSATASVTRSVIATY